MGKLEFLTVRVLGSTENFYNVPIVSYFFFHVFMGKYKIRFSAHCSIKKLCNIKARKKKLILSLKYFFGSRNKAQLDVYEKEELPSSMFPVLDTDLCLHRTRL